MSIPEIFLDYAEDCAFFADRAEAEETKLAFKRMEAAWRTLAEEQEQLNRKGLPTKKPSL
jgi:hypothetical protein